MKPESYTVFGPWEEKEPSDEELRGMFGQEAIISRVGPFRLIHLDRPAPQEVARRVAEFNPDELFEDDCPLCQMLRAQGGNVIFEDFHRKT